MGFAQDAVRDWESAAGGKQQFAVASVRENTTGDDSTSNFTLDGNGNTYWVMNEDVKTSPTGSLFLAVKQPALRYIIFAYRLGGTQELALRGAGLGFSWAGIGMKVPGWLTDVDYDIEARAPGAATKDQMRLMMQSLLVERFKLVVHREVRQVPVFALALVQPATLGPQLRKHPAQDSCVRTVYRDAARGGDQLEKRVRRRAVRQSASRCRFPAG
ncbi:MAG TPA: TIGR03435 family protein [Acidobacteriaceae bacterium]|nr:TIGR03435 family protein [Acidobacteriaceae bacterium]